MIYAVDRDTDTILVGEIDGVPDIEHYIDGRRRPPDASRLPAPNFLCIKYDTNKLELTSTFFCTGIVAIMEATG